MGLEAADQFKAPPVHPTPSRTTTAGRTARPMSKKEGHPMLEKLPPKIIEHPNGGKGRIILQPIAGPEILKDKCRLYVKCTLAKGCSMGIHQHKGDGEIYYILSGRGLYTDNDSTYEVGPGDATFCKSGDRHGLENIGDEDLVFMGLIIYDK
jgi:mannose-6-phosphate isomerase-like protein (cupin superfamily)